MTHEQLRESAAAYALGALDDADRVAFEAHLPDCVECRAEVSSYRPVAGLLAHAAPGTNPPASLRARVLRHARPVRASAAARRRPGWGAQPAWLAAAACLALAVWSGLSLRSERSRSNTVNAELAEARAELASRDSVVSALLGPEVHVVSLSEPDRKPAMRVFWNHTRNVFIVTAANLPAPPAGKAYQLWAIQKGKAPLSMGTFVPGTDGRAATIIPVSASITDAGVIDNCGVTLEPLGGSPQPTESPRLLGTWRHVD
jgi:anti-sigma-K factor RskA